MAVLVLNPALSSAVLAAATGTNGTREQGVVQAVNGSSGFNSGQVRIRFYQNTTLRATQVHAAGSLDLSSTPKLFIAGAPVSWSLSAAGTVNRIVLERPSDNTELIQLDGTDLGVTNIPTGCTGVRWSAPGFRLAARVGLDVGDVPTNTTAPSITAYNGASATAVGSMLMVNPGTWTKDVDDTSSWQVDPYNNPGRQPPRPMKFALVRRYQWLRNGSPIADQVGLTYNTTSADAGQNISVRETVTQVLKNPIGQSQNANGNREWIESTTEYTATSAAVIPSGTQNSALVYSNNLTYVGSFRFQNYGDVTGNYGQDSLQYSGNAVAYDPAGNGGNGSLFIVNGAGRTFEYSIPTPSSLANPSSLPVATVLQPPVGDGGFKAAIEAVGGPAGFMGGVIHNGQLIQSAAALYTNDTTAVSHVRRARTLATTGIQRCRLTTTVSGQTQTGRFTAGSMCLVPTAVGSQKNWQTALGGPVLTGVTNISISTSTNTGPPAYAFDPDAIATAGGGDVSAVALATYPAGWELDGDPGSFGSFKRIFNWSSLGYGADAKLIPFGTQSLLHFGHGTTGRDGYNDSQSYEFFNYAPEFGGFESNVFDTGNQQSRGPFAYPYHPCVWAYNLQDLEDARLGLRDPRTIRPYGKFSFFSPYWTNPRGRYGINGGCYDPQRRRIYLINTEVLSFGDPICMVYEVTNAVAV